MRPCSLCHCLHERRMIHSTLNTTPCIRSSSTAMVMRKSCASVAYPVTPRYSHRLTRAILIRRTLLHMRKQSGMKSRVFITSTEKPDVYSFKLHLHQNFPLLGTTFTLPTRFAKLHDKSTCLFANLSQYQKLQAAPSSGSVSHSNTTRYHSNLYPHKYPECLSRRHR